MGASWSDEDGVFNEDGVTSLLRHCRLYEDGVFNEDAMGAVIALATTIEKRDPQIDKFLLHFGEKADALYKLVMPRLPVDRVPADRWHHQRLRAVQVRHPDTRPSPIRQRLPSRQ